MWDEDKDEDKDEDEGALLVEEQAGTGEEGFAECRPHSSCGSQEAKGGTEAGGRNNLARFVRILQKQIKRVLRLDGYPTATSLRPPIIPLHRVSAQLISSHK